MKLEKYSQQIAVACKKIAGNHFLVCGLSPAGQLITEESVDSGTCFREQDAEEQITFAGQSSLRWIRERFELLSMYL